MAAAWQDSLADEEAAATMEFGVALNELATECVERGFTYPELGFSCAKRRSCEDCRPDG